MSAKNTIQVIISGKIYTLGGYESEDYLQRVAAYMNKKTQELSSLDGYQRMNPDLRSLLLNLNIADDYFKTRKRIEEMEEDLKNRDKEIYDLKQELITAQMKLENLEKEAAAARQKQSGHNNNYRR